jgi:glutamate-ammonia-ligase adenylyltransferase
MPLTLPTRRDTLGPQGLDAIESFRARGGGDDPAHVRLVGLLGEHAPSLLPHVLAEPAMLGDVLTRPLSHPSDERSLAGELARACGSLVGDEGPALRQALRRFRHRAMVRIVLREVLRLADVEQTSAEMAHLASVLVDAALRAAAGAEQSRYGVARDPSGREVPRTVLGMGKLGGLELNLGSDIDLIFFYETDDAQVESGELTVHELESRIVRRTVKALSEVTEDGFCFRVDLRLRPEGTRGPLVNSLVSAERYYESWGRTWERAALLRARPIAGDREFGERLLATLRPFVYRRAVDPSLALQMGEMLTRSRRELKVDLEADVKLGRGGIREAEFFVQTLQLVWGGQHPELQVPGTLEALKRLRAAGLVTDREAETLTDAWALLRRVEHRIHVRAGYQTHALPSEPAELGRFAQSLGYADAVALKDALGRTRDGVEQLFASLAPIDEDDREQPWDELLERVAQGTSADALAESVEALLSVRDAFEAASHLVRLARRANGPLGPVTWERLPQVGRMLLAEVSGAADPDGALRFLAEFFARLGGPWPYERLLLEKPRLTRRLIGLFGASGTLASALVGHPEDVDLLMTSAAPTLAEIASSHDRVMHALDADPDPEPLVSELRRIKRAMTLRIGLAYVGGEIDLGDAADRLSEVAEGQVRVSLAASTRWAEARWGRPSERDALVVCAMGKLGGRELGFGGDLDLVFLYGADGETEPTPSGRTTTCSDLFARIAQRTMLLLRQRDAEGSGYETDTRLRPSGSKGTLVVSLAAFDAYHARGAAAWERQALLRARPIAGDASVGAAAQERFTRLAYGSGATPPEELAHARARIQAELAGERSGRYHPKLGFGGLVDVEFVVQWLQMHHGEDEALRTPSTPRAIEALTRQGHLTSVGGQALREAYVFFRGVEQSLKLLDEHRESILEPAGRTGSHVARSLGLRARDGMSVAEVLDDTYRRHAHAVRALFEATVAPVGVGPCWDGPGSR